MARARRWSPSDSQTVQLLFNRGYLDRVQVEFLCAYRALGTGQPLVAVALERGFVDEDDVRRAVYGAREDDALRDLIRRYDILTEAQLVAVHKLQRGSKRSLLQTLLDEGLCPPALQAHLEALPDGGRGAA